MKKNQFFVKMYGPQILKVNRKKTSDAITFSLFVNYLISLYQKNLPFDEHWAPFVTLCHPCHVPYDFVGKYETLYEDAEQILSRVHAPSNIHFPVTKMSKTPKVVHQYFQNLTHRQTNYLMRIYEADFLVFGYSKNYSNFMNSLNNFTHFTLNYNLVNNE